MNNHVERPSQARRRLAPVVMTLAAWLVAFLVVTALLTFLGDQVQSLPLELRALLISGVLVTLMVNVVMPFLSVAVTRWVAGPARARNSAAPPARSGEKSRV